MQVIVTSFFFFLLIADGRLFQPWFSFLKQQMLYVVNWELFLDQFSLVIVKIEFELGLCNCWFCMFDGIFFIFFFVLLFLFWRVVISNYWYWCDNTANEKWKLFVADFYLMFVLFIFRNSWLTSALQDVDLRSARSGVLNEFDSKQNKKHFLDSVCLKIIWIYHVFRRLS